MSQSLEKVWKLLNESQLAVTEHSGTQQRKPAALSTCLRKANFAFGCHCVYTQRQTLRNNKTLTISEIVHRDLPSRCTQLATTGRKRAEIRHTALRVVHPEKEMVKLCTN